MVDQRTANPHVAVQVRQRTLLLYRLWLATYPTCIKKLTEAFFQEEKLWKKLDRLFM